MNSTLIWFPRNFSKVLHSLTNCIKGTFEILNDKFTYFAEHSIHYFILNFVFLHTHGIFSKTRNLLGENIYMSSKCWVRFLLNALSLKCYMIHFHHQSTFKILPCLVILKYSGTQQFSYKNNRYMKNLFLTRVFHEYRLLTQHYNFSLSTVSYLSPHNKFTNYFLVRKIASTMCILHPICLELKAGFYVVCKLNAHSIIKGYIGCQLYTQASYSWHKVYKFSTLQTVSYNTPHLTKW